MSLVTSGSSLVPGSGTDGAPAAGGGVASLLASAAAGAGGAAGLVAGHSAGVQAGGEAGTAAAMAALAAAGPSVQLAITQATEAAFARLLPQLQGMVTSSVATSVAASEARTAAAIAAVRSPLPAFPPALGSARVAGAGVGVGVATPRGAAAVRPAGSTSSGSTTPVSLGAHDDLDRAVEAARRRAEADLRGEGDDDVRVGDSRVFRHAEPSLRHVDVLLQGSRSFEVWRRLGVGSSAIATLKFEQLWITHICSRLEHGLAGAFAKDTLDVTLALLESPHRLPRVEAALLRSIVYVTTTAIYGAKLGARVTSSYNADRMPLEFRRRLQYAQAAESGLLAARGPSTAVLREVFHDLPADDDLDHAGMVESQRPPSRRQRAAAAAADLPDAQRTRRNASAPAGGDSAAAAAAVLAAAAGSALPRAPPAGPSTAAAGRAAGRGGGARGGGREGATR